MFCEARQVVLNRCRFGVYEDTVVLDQSRHCMRPPSVLNTNRSTPELRQDNFPLSREASLHEHHTQHQTFLYGQPTIAMPLFVMRLDSPGHNSGIRFFVCAT